VNTLGATHRDARTHQPKAVVKPRAHDPANRFAGVVAAVVTPCESPGNIDPAAMSRLCRVLASQGCDGLFIAASTGEAVLLDEVDRRSLTVAAREAVPEVTTIYMGVSGLGLKQTIRYAQNAAEDGADAAVVMAPFFLKVGQREVAEYLLAIADASPIPVALYHHPRMTTPIGVETVARVAEHANIVAMKDTSPTMERAESLIRATAATNISILQGNESLVLNSLQLGAHGMVTALAGIVPEWHAKLFNAVRDGNPESANQFNDRIVQLWQMFGFEDVGRSISSFACSIKLALQRRGWLENLDGMLTGFTPDEAFKRLIQEHLNRVGVPTSDGRELRIDPPHVLGGDQGAVA
jgi:4-hydroxy-tetrahydrodipicolinate synthase